MDVDAVRAVVGELPGAIEGTWYGALAFRVKGRVLARIDVEDDDALVVRCGRLYRDALIARDSDRFGLTNHPPERDTSVVMHLSKTRTKHLDEVKEILAEAWQIAVDGRLSNSGRERI